MILRLYNKWCIALDKLLDKAEKIHGLPKQIDLTETEMLNLLTELSDRKVFEVYGKQINIIKHEKSQTYSLVTFLFTTHLSQAEERLNHIELLKQEELQISYRGVPLKIYNENQQNKERTPL